MLERPDWDDVMYVVNNAGPLDREEWSATRYDGWNVNGVAGQLATYMDGLVGVLRDEENLPYYISGIYVTSPGVARGWAIRTEAWKPHMLTAARIHRAVVDVVMGSGDIRRLEAWCPMWAQWPRVLGLKREAVLKKYCRDGADISIWSRT